jgi:hypothetical protein
MTPFVGHIPHSAPKTSYSTTIIPHGMTITYLYLTRPERAEVRETKKVIDRLISKTINGSVKVVSN